MKMSFLALSACLAVGCSYGPDHLPALYSQREVFQGHIDRVLEDMARAMELHRTEPPIDERRFAFEEVGQAIKALPEGQHFGKVCSRF